MSPPGPDRILTRVAIAVALLLVASVGRAHADNVGKLLVEANCARCHAIGREDKSRHPQAPPFRKLADRYPLDALEEAFVEGVSVGHPDMPEFMASPRQIEAIIDYIGTIQP